ncbi:Galactokinase [Atractiella rhizophila]|nr:Galactokinase [Atractiella rhizophila]
MSDAIPRHTSLSTIYTSKTLLHQGERWDALSKSFEQEFGKKPMKIARAPGRVNIIGEHIDYSGFAVLPAAIERDVLIAISWAPSSSGNHTIDLRNVNPKYERTTISFPASDHKAESVNMKEHAWGNYFKAALKGILGRFAPQIGALEICALMTGNVPPGGGISSSAAFVIASGLAVIEAFGIKGVSRKEFTELVIVSETWVGVKSGGMDQSASIFSIPESLLHIHFVPQLLATPVPLPKVDPKFSFVIANTLVTSEKHLTAKFHYNLRVVECRIASILLNSALALSLPLDPLPTLKALTDAYFKANTADDVSTAISQLQEMSSLTDRHLGKWKDGMTWNEVYSATGLDKEAFHAKVAPFEVEAEKLQVWKRAKHVFEESLRVYQFRHTLENSIQAGAGVEMLEKLGEFMNLSQNSCDELYDCSCPEINEMVQISREAGAFGARLTGAGWGGCTVHLIPESIENDFIETLKQRYYVKKFPELMKKEDTDFEQFCFATKPENGACVYDF